jgi:hypothetical protein
MTLRPHARSWRSGLTALALAVSGAASAPAQAETLFGAFSPDVGAAFVAASVTRQGYVVRSAIVRRGDVYLCDVSDPDGFMERLVVDARTGRIAQRFAWRAADYAVEPQRFAPPVGTGGLFTSPPRPEADIPGFRPQVTDASPDDDEPPLVHRRQMVYGSASGRDLLAAPPLTEQKPVERPKARIARPKPAWTTPPSTKPSDTASVPKAADPAPAQPAAPIEAAKPTAAAPSSSESAKSAPVAPVKSEGVVASSGQTESAPAPAPPPAPAPAAAPAPAKSKAINDIPVAPLD